MLALLPCLFLMSCVTPVYVPDNNAQRIMQSDITHLERVSIDGPSREPAMDVAVLVGIHEKNNGFVALAPVAINQTALREVDYSLICTLDLEQSKELLRIVIYAIQNYDENIGDQESINASFQSALQSTCYEFRGSKLAPILSQRMIFTFANVGPRSEAEINFYGPPSARSISLLNKKKLGHFRLLLEKAISKIDAKQ